MKKLTALILALGLALSACAGCGDKPAERYGSEAKAFVDAVAAIDGEITLASERAILDALAIYDGLSEADRNSGAVVSAKKIVDTYRSLYNLLKNDADGEAAAAARAEKIRAFVESVNALPLLSALEVQDRALIAAAYAAYESLDDAARETPGVSAARKRLVEADAAVAALEAEEERKAVEAEAAAYLEKCGALPETVNALDEDTRTAIYECLYMYDALSEGAKAAEGVAEAKAAVDTLAAAYTALEDKDYADKFIEAVAKLPSTADVTLADKENLLDAESAYQFLTEAALGLDGVAQAVSKLEDARAVYDVLDEAEEVNRIARFLESVGGVPDPEAVVIDDFFALEKAQAFYDELNAQSCLREDVRAAKATLDRAQRAFDANGWDRIAMKDPNIQFSGDRPPHIVLQMDAWIRDAVCGFYGEKLGKTVTPADLTGEVIMWLNIYEEGKGGADFAGRVELPVATSLGHIIPGGAVLNAVRAVAAAHPNNIGSGQKIGFSINFEDAKNRYVPSPYTKAGFSVNYTW